VEDIRLQPSHRNTIPHHSHAMETLSRAGKPRRPPLERATRRPDKLLDIWWNGPLWLGKHEEYWPSRTFTTSKSVPEEKKKNPSHVLTATISASLIDATRFSSYWKLVRTTAWVFRFLQNARGKEKSAGEITATEIAAARMYWVRVVQKESFMAELEALQWNSALHCQVSPK